MRMALGQLRTRVGEGAARIMLEMPFARDDIAQKGIELCLVGDQLLIEEAGIPIVKHMADIEDDGPQGQRISPGAP
jgi:hypothetical protein